MSYFASSASPLLVNWHEEKPLHLMEMITEEFNHTLEEVRELAVNTEHTIADICEHFGVHDFSHNLANRNLGGATLALYSDGTLEIRREGAKHATAFPVQLIA